MNLHLNYDGKQNNGIIFNDLYTDGALFNGVDFKPALSFEYDSFQYSEVFDTLDFKLLNGNKTILSPEQIIEIVSVATDWVQPIGQQGNPSLEQLIQFKKSEILNSFNTDVNTITTAQPHEMISWRKQEDQARAWNVDNLTPTPTIDAILSTRVVVGETKQILVDKIISKADSYAVTYGELLGKYQTLSKDIELANDVMEINNIIW